MGRRLAVLTLRKIQRTPGFTSGTQVKISQSAVAMTQLLSNLAVRNDWLLRRLFARATAGLPCASLSAPRHPSAPHCRWCSRRPTTTTAPLLCRWTCAAVKGVRAVESQFAGCRLRSR